MTHHYELEPVEGGLLNQGVIQIYGTIDDDVEDYVQKCITIMEANNSPTLKIKINSPGGELAASFAIHDLIKFYSGHTVGLVVGQACSGGNLILQACTTRAASSGSILMVHNMLAPALSLNVMRDKREWMETFKQMERWQAKIYGIYQKKTGMTRREIRKIFDDEKALTAEQAKKLRLIDEVIDEIPHEDNNEFIIQA